MHVSRTEDLQSLLAAIFRCLGATAKDADAVAGGLIEAELTGHQSHGLIRVSEYACHIREGVIVPGGEPRIVRDEGSTLLIDGNWGFGQVIARQATEWLIERGLHHGVAAAGIRRCGHVGRVGAYPELAAEQGLAAMAFVNGGGSEPRLAPYGGRQAVFGTNPLAAAMPIPGSSPVVVDFSTAAVASGKIRVLRDRGELLPEGWILDRDGRPSVDPADYYDGGMLTPAAGHKGYGLALLVELLAGCLTGAGSLATAGAEYHVGNGMFMVAISLSALGEPEEYAAGARKLADAIRATPPAPGFPAVMLPGDPERQAAAELSPNGVDIDDSTWGAISQLAAELDIQLDMA